MKAMRTETQIISRNTLVNQLLHIGHGDLSIYTQTGLRAAQEEPELFAHLIAWNEINGEVRDSKTALPVLALRGDRDLELYENAAAHLCKLSTRDLLRACRYDRSLITPGHGGRAWLKRAVINYIRHRERNCAWWIRTAVQHRRSLKSLYKMYNVKPIPYAQDILFDKKYPARSVFEAIKQLKHMVPMEAAGTILNHKIPFLIAVGALGGIKDKPDVILAMINNMSASELLNSTNMLKQAGVFENSMLKAAYDKGIKKVQVDKRVSTLKVSKAAEVMKKSSPKVSKVLDRVQEQKLDKISIDGDWLVLADKSGSMSRSISVARHVSASIARLVKGNVHLVFFDSHPTYFDVSGKTLGEITEITKRMRAGGSTSIGCGLDYILEKGIVVNGIAICSDGGENGPPAFANVYNRYEQKIGIRPTVYLYHVPGDPNHLEIFCKQGNVQLETFEVGDIDYYAIPNLVKTMRSNRYSLVDEIMVVPLLKFGDVFKNV